LETSKPVTESLNLTCYTLNRISGTQKVMCFKNSHVWRLYWKALQTFIIQGVQTKIVLQIRRKYKARQRVILLKYNTSNIFWKQHVSPLSRNWHVCVWYCSWYSFLISFLQKVQNARNKHNKHLQDTVVVLRVFYLFQHFFISMFYVRVFMLVYLLIQLWIIFDIVY